MRGAYAEMGVTMVIESFVVIVVGGMGSLLGAVVAGLLIGQVVGLTTLFVPKAAEIMVFVVMALVYFVFMMVGSAIVRVPAPGWKPARRASCRKRWCRRHSTRSRSAGRARACGSRDRPRRPSRQG